MNRNSGSLVRAMLLSVLGLSIGAIPAGAGVVGPWAIEFGATIVPYGFLPPPGNSEAAYSSANQGGNPFDFAGLQTILADPTSSLTTSPSSMPPGLTGGTLDLSAVSTVADVSASLATGAAHMYATSLPDVPNEPDSQALLNAYMQDYLTFSVAGGGSANIDIGLLLDGSVTGATGADYEQYMQLDLGGGNFTWYATSSTAPAPTTSGSWQSTSLANDTATGFNFNGTLTVTNGETVGIYLVQTLNCGFGAMCDFSNTAQLSLGLPAGATYSSASGVFLTQSTPEPGSLILLGLGIAALGFVRRRRLVRF